MLFFILNESVFVPTFRLLLYIGDNDTRTFFLNYPSQCQEVLHFMVRSRQQKNSSFISFEMNVNN